MVEGLVHHSSISHYRIVSKIGAGGMGEVYRAHDSRLDREVAIKMLPDNCSGDADRLLRFQQEARATSALNHPNILTVYDIGEHDGTPYIVEELLEGEELRDRLLKGPIPLRKTIDYAQQIVSGLAAAHERGIVHRDLKPENLFITKDDRVKILDFGLAKLREPKTDNRGSEDVTRKAITNPGVVMGTVGYMSPELVRGQAADYRSDIFAFGAILHEMVTGRRAFHEETVAETMSAILNREPEELTGSNPNISPSLERIVHRCLEKKAERRFQSTADLAFAIEALSTGPSSELSRSATSLPAPGKRLPAWALVTAAIVATAVIATAAGWFLRRAPSSNQPRLVVNIVPPKEVEISPIGTINSVIELSPDGRSLVVRGSKGLFVRNFDAMDFYQVAGSEAVSNQPFWNGSSRITFKLLSTTDLVSVRLPDGVPELVSTSSGVSRGGSWSDKGSMLISLITRLVTRGPDGGSIVVENTTKREGRLSYPDFLPASEDFLLFFNERWADTGEVWLATFTGTALTNVNVLFKNRTAARYTPAGGGHVLFVKSNNLYSQRLDLSNRALTGEPELVVRDVASQPATGIVKADFSVSRNGVIAWRTGEEANSQVTVFDRSGKIVGVAGSPGSADGIALSNKDDSQVLVLSGGRSSFIAEPGRTGTNPIIGDDVSWIDWTADGEMLVGRRGYEIFTRPVEGGAISLLGRMPISDFSYFDISPDRKHILTRCGDAGLICWLALSDNGVFSEPAPLFASKEPMEDATFSPDGKMVLYRVSRGLPSEGIYVQPFPGPGRRHLLSPAGADPVWRKDGKEIIYQYDRAVWSIAVSGGAGALSFSEPQKLFDGLRRSPSAVGLSRGLAVSSDGSKIFWVQGVDQPDTGVINVMFGFFDNK